MVVRRGMNARRRVLEVSRRCYSVIHGEYLNQNFSHKNSQTIGTKKKSDDKVTTFQQKIILFQKIQLINRWITDRLSENRLWALLCLSSFSLLMRERQREVERKEEETSPKEGWVSLSSSVYLNEINNETRVIIVVASGKFIICNILEKNSLTFASKSLKSCYF